MNHCEAHDAAPTNNPADVCNGELFECSRCHLKVCAGFGGCDDLCDRCFSGRIATSVLNHIRPVDPDQVGREVNEAICNIVDVNYVNTVE